MHKVWSLRRLSGSTHVADDGAGAMRGSGDDVFTTADRLDADRRPRRRIASAGA
jgi:hypothetical protein